MTTINTSKNWRRPVGYYKSVCRKTSWVRMTQHLSRMLSRYSYHPKWPNIMETNLMLWRGAEYCNRLTSLAGWSTTPHKFLHWRHYSACAMLLVLNPMYFYPYSRDILRRISILRILFRTIYVPDISGCRKIHRPHPKVTMLLALALISFVGVVLVLAFVPFSTVRQQTKGQIPVSVNYFFTRQCNKSCKLLECTSWTLYLVVMSKDMPQEPCFLVI